MLGLFIGQVNSTLSCLDYDNNRVNGIEYRLCGTLKTAEHHFIILKPDRTNYSMRGGDQTMIIIESKITPY